MAADSPSVASGLQPGGAGFSALSAQRRRFAPPPEGATLSDEEKQADGRDFVRHRFHGWRPDGDGQEQAGRAGPPASVECVLAGQGVWQADMGGGKWQDVDPTWTEPLLQALREGHGTLRLPHTYLNKHGEEVRSWYTIDCTDTSVTQKNEVTGKQRELRLVQMMAPAVVTPLDATSQDVQADP